jgi:hypothetical protein
VLLVTVLLVLVSSVLLIVGIARDSLGLIWLSIAFAAAAGIVLVVFSQLSRRRAVRVLAEVGPAELRSRAGAAPPEAGGAPSVPVAAAFPIEDYDDLRVADIVPLLSDLDAAHLRLVRNREAAGKNRTTVLRRIDDLLDRQPVAGAAGTEATTSGRPKEVPARTAGAEDAAEAATAGSSPMPASSPPSSSPESSSPPPPSSPLSSSPSPSSPSPGQSGASGSEPPPTADEE